MNTLFEWAPALGFAAAALTTAAFIPQAFKTMKTRDVTGLSVPMYTLFTLGVALWLIYGIVVGAWPIIVANAITLCLALIILGLALWYRKKPPPPCR